MLFLVFFHRIHTIPALRFRNFHIRWRGTHVPIHFGNTTSDVSQGLPLSQVIKASKSNREKFNKHDKQVSYNPTLGFSCSHIVCMTLANSQWKTRRDRRMKETCIRTTNELPPIFYHQGTNGWSVKLWAASAICRYSPRGRAPEPSSRSHLTSSVQFSRQLKVLTLSYYLAVHQHWKI